MTVHPILKQGDFADVEYKVRDIQRAASLFRLFGDLGVEAAHRGTTLSLDDMRGLAWLAETMKDMADDLDATLFPKSTKTGG